MLWLKFSGWIFYSINPQTIFSSFFYIPSPCLSVIFLLQLINFVKLLPLACLAGKAGIPIFRESLRTFVAKKRVATKTPRHQETLSSLR